MSQPIICQVLHSLTVGGAEVLAAGLARRLGHQYQFEFVCLDELGALGQQLREEGFSVEVLGRRPGFDWRCTRDLSAYLRSKKVDIVHAHQYGPFLYSMAAGLMRRRPAVLFTEHGRTFPDFPRRKRMVVNRLLLRPRDRVTAVGEAVRQALIRNEGIRPNRIDVIYNGVNLMMPSTNGANAVPCDAPRAAVRREIGVGDSDYVVIQVARLDALKDHLTAIRTLERVAAQLPNVRLVVVGDGPTRGEIETEIAKRAVAPHVRLLGLRGDVPRLLRAADTFLLTSVSEGIPLTIIEAMAAGLPIVSTKVGGVAEVVQDGVTGVLAPSGDDAALAAAILRLGRDRELEHRMGQLGRQRAQQMFSEEQMHAGYSRLYAEMLSA